MIDWSPRECLTMWVITDLLNTSSTSTLPVLGFWPVWKPWRHQGLPEIRNCYMFTFTNCDHHHHHQVKPAVPQSLPPRQQEEKHCTRMAGLASPIYHIVSLLSGIPQIWSTRKSKYGWVGITLTGNDYGTTWWQYDGGQRWFQSWVPWVPVMGSNFNAVLSRIKWWRIAPVFGANFFGPNPECST